MNKFINIHTHSDQNVDNNDIIEVKSINVDDNTDVDAFPFCTIAAHPYSIKPSSSFIEYNSFLERNIIKDNVIAIGETGLDRTHNDSFTTQKRVFLEHILMSEKYQKPMILHVVRVFPDIIELRKQTRATMPWIIHGFQANEQTIEQLLRHNFYLSLGDVLYKNEERAKKLLEIIPLERLFFETDTRETSIIDVYNQASFLSNKTIDEFRKPIFSNFVKIFKTI